MAPVDPGLCRTCVNARVVRGARSTFWSCELSRTDPHFPRYPALPVLRCAGYSVGDPSPRREGPGDYFFDAS